MNRLLKPFLALLLPVLISGTTPLPPDPEPLSPTHLTGGQALAPFFQLLDQPPGRPIRVVHFGDSHVQADWFPQATRDSLQAWFGKAGRGWIFPYGVAKTHGPKDLTWTYSGIWTSKKLISAENGTQCGFGGYVLETTDANASLTLTCKPDSAGRIAYPFWEVWTGKGPGHYDLTFQTPDEQRLLLLGASSRSFEPYRSSIYLSQPASQVTLRPSGKGERLQVYGLSAYSRLDGGIAYFASGVNGARYDQYLAAPIFWEQLNDLSPDLVIVSLGANDSHSRRFDAEAFRTQVMTTIRKIKAAAPGSAILLTTPPGAYLYGKPNPANALATAVIWESAQAEGVACWDFFALMGGEGAIASWKREGLAHTDLIHLTKSGYFLQGSLLARELRHAYEVYRRDVSK